MTWRLVLLLVFLAGTGAAQTFDGCTKSQTNSLRTAIADAKALAVVAAAAVGPTEEYERWFGKYSPGKAEIVRRNFKSIVAGIRTGAVTAQCTRTGVGACERDTYAFVYDNEPYRIHICPGFFGLPKMADLDPGSAASDNGTRAGAIIHEISHFNNVANTEDECYTREVCSRMARRSVDRAVRNADSYQYYAEDVTFYTINDPALGAD